VAETERTLIEVLVHRGEIVESRHRIQVAVSDAAGRVVLATDPAGYVTSFRSAAKPFQLLPLVERGHADRWNCSDEELAVMAASHTGSPRHLGLVAGLLDRLGLEARHLACGFHEPRDPQSLAAVRSGAPPSGMYNNCSGKHAGMLMLARSEGWSIEGYERPDHPLQRLMRATVAECTGFREEDLQVAVDGCGVSVFGLPLAGMARAYAMLASAGAGGDARGRALARIRDAMRAHPVVIGGEGELSTAIVQETAGRILAKGGAEGLECMALPGGLGVALKCEDGHARARGPASVAVLARLGALDGDARARLGAWERPPVHNAAGAEVGWLDAVMTPVVEPAAAGRRTT